MTGILTGDIRLIGESLDSDIIIEPVRGVLKELRGHDGRAIEDWRGDNNSGQRLNSDE